MFGERPSRTTKYIGVVLGQALKLFQTVGADALLLEIGDLIDVLAKNTSGNIFFEYDRIVVNENFKWIPDLDVHVLTDLGRNYNSAELVYFAYHSR